eukprot:9696884-Heterocapsa_arctica.AAC.1
MQATLRALSMFSCGFGVSLAYGRQKPNQLTCRGPLHVVPKRPTKGSNLVFNEQTWTRMTFREHGGTEWRRSENTRLEAQAE